MIICFPRISRWPSAAQFHIAAAIHYRDLAQLYAREGNLPAWHAERQLMRSHALEAVRRARTGGSFAHRWRQPAAVGQVVHFPQ